MNTEQGKFEHLFSELGRKADQWLEQARDATEDTRHDINDRLKDLQHTKEKLEEELNAYAKDEERWKNVRSRLNKAADEMKGALELIFAKKKDRTAPPPASDTHA